MIYQGRGLGVKEMRREEGGKEGKSVETAEEGV